MNHTTRYIGPRVKHFRTKTNIDNKNVLLMRRKLENHGSKNSTRTYFLRAVEKCIEIVKQNLPRLDITYCKNGV